MKLVGKTALVTGGTRGIGLAIANHLQNQGAKVFVTGTKPAPQLPSTLQALIADFSDDQEIARFAQNLQDFKVDILVNNAGINKIAPFSEIPIDDFTLIQKVNVTAPFRLSQAVLPYMRNQKWGRIVNISSIFSEITKAQRASYSTSKFGVVGMTKALAVEVAAQGILVNAIAPGFIDTELTRKVLGESGMAELAKQVPIGRMGSAEEIASVVGFLVSPENTFLTGQNIVVDGGFTSV
jgi:NAD(P)-dependent dehydrogenase (short-subunit alcohol dehydrogenase family)